MMLLTELAKSYHCPLRVMAYIAHKSPDLLATIREFGPMRIYWSAEWGWKLDGQPVHVRRVDGVVVWHPTQSKRDGTHDCRWP